MSEQRGRFEELSPEARRELLKERLKNAKRQKSESPVSDAQWGVLFREQLGAGSNYNTVQCWRLRGPVDAGALEKSIGEFVRRHEALRTCFPSGDDGLPVHQVWEQVPLPFALVDLGRFKEEDRDAEAQRVIEDEASRAFDLERAPLMRTVLLQRSAAESILLFVFHHVVCDGWSLGVLYSELEALYREFTGGERASLAAIEFQYADHSKWQRETLTSEKLEDALEYWKGRLTDAPRLDLLTDRRGAQDATAHGAGTGVVIPAAVTSQLRQLAREAGATLYMALLAGFYALLQRYTGQSDLVVGTPSAGRSHAESKALMGFFVNMLPMRVDLSGNLGFRESLSRVREVALGAFGHGDVPFERIVKGLGLQREIGNAPLFDVTFAMQNAARALLVLPGIEVTSYETQFVPVHFDLEVHATEQDNEDIRCQFRYDANLFDATTIERLGRHYMNLLRAAVADPDARLSMLGMLGAEERRELLEVHGQSREFAVDRCLHQLFERQVGRAPDATAAVCEEESLTYAQLDKRANQLAHLLIERGVKPGSLVGLCLDRSLDLVVAILGILKAGGAYVPLDLANPVERIHSILDDTHVPVLVTESAQLDKLAGHSAVQICLDAECETIAQAPTAAPETIVGPDHDAYVIYTSGSTGRPKGVPVTHRAAVRLFLATDHWYGFTERDVWSLFHSYAFDVSVFELWGALLYGGRLVVVPYWVSRSPEEFHELLRRERVTVLSQTPSAFRQLIAADETRDAEPTLALRYVILAGEALNPQMLAPWFARHGDEQPLVVNMYGTTETVVHATYRPMRKADCAVPSSLIGRPIPDLQLYVLDESQELVPVGVPGELYVGGAGVGRGYLNRPELTASRFLPDPFRPGPDARMYRTGDVARFLPGGEIEYLGRNDDQVKIRGHRVELGEIESALVEHEGLRQAVAMIREDRAGDPRLVAYVVAESGPTPSVAELKDHLRHRVPEYEVPSAIVVVDAFPLTPTGKLDRRALPTPGGQRSVGDEYVAPRSEIESMIAGIWRDVLDVDHVGIHDNFFDLGGHSILLTRVRSRLAKTLDRVIPTVALFRYPTVSALAEHLSDGQIDAPVRTAAQARVKRQAIAIVGMSCRFPGAPDTERFWENLRNAVESIRFFDADELRAAGIDAEQLNHPDYVRAKGYLEGADLFDAGFFGYSPRQAGLIDPQHRLFLEVAYEALEAAGCDPERYAGRIGVFAGCEYGAYGAGLRGNPDVARSTSAFDLLISSERDYLPTRVSYKLNLRGPAVNVQTACSTSLVAIHIACQSLLLDECTMALAGGASVSLPLQSGYLHRPGGILSRDGHCRAFDADASGMLVGNGVGIVVLKRLEDALADGDPIHALMLGSAINNDGSQKVGYTAPGIEGQVEVITTAHALARIDPETIGYVETHGTGTSLGDPIEIAALSQVFRERTQRKQFCGIGALKSNVGHMGATAGVGGLIKAALALKHGTIPPTLHFRTPNPEIDFEHSPFYVVAEPTPWSSDALPRRAAVSAFGIGGTNAHVVLEEAPAREPTEPSRDSQLLVLSAKTAPALDAMTARLVGHLEEHGELELTDVAFTLQVGRTRHSHRRALACRDTADAIATLQGAEPRRLLNASSSVDRRRVVFLFTGQGAQYPQMGRGLYENEPLYREIVDRCCDLLQAEIGFDLREVLMPDAGSLEEATARIQRTETTQPALFVTEYALARLWMSWGVTPCAMIGHSIGEYVAACLAGEFSLDYALRLVAARGRLMGSLPGGSMLAVFATEEALAKRLPAALTIAVLNAHDRCVVSGPDDDIDAFAAELEADGLRVRRLLTSHAFHSAMMDPILDSFRAEVQSTPRQQPQIPYVSNVSGEWKTAEQAADAGYWAEHLRRGVRFADGLKSLFAREPDAILLEVGPGDTLASLARRHPDRGADQVALPSLRPPQTDAADSLFLREALGRMWLHGLQPDWAAVHGDVRRNKLALPTYPFERQRYWVGSGPSAEPRDALRRIADPARWIYVPEWRRLPSPAGLVPGESVRFLLFVDESGLGLQVAEGLRDAGHEAVCVITGELFERKDARTYVVDPSDPTHYASLLADLDACDSWPERIAHFWSVSADGLVDAEDESLADRAFELGFYSLLFLMQAVDANGAKRPLELTTVTSQVHEVTGTERLCPAKAAALGPAKVIPMEFPDVRCRSLDVDLPADEPERERRTRDLVQELCAPEDEAVVAYRGRYRWAQAFNRVRVPSTATDDAPPRLREGGVYLITGGLGGVGLIWGVWLARVVRARLVLVGRSAMPPRDTWDSWLGEHPEDDETSVRIAQIREMESAGAEVLTISADVTDEDAMRGVLDELLARFGELHGVIHAAGTRNLPTPIRETDRATCERVFAPKRRGLAVLERVLAGRELDLCLIHSSLAAVMGVLDGVAYTAAHLFMDEAVWERRRSSSLPWTTVNWDTWRTWRRETAPVPRGLAEFMMSAAEAEQAMRLALNLGDTTQLLVSSGDPQARIERWRRAGRKEEEETAGTAPDVELHPRSASLSNEYEAPRNETERTLAGIWQQLLGLDQVGINDDFFELGGDSLLAIDLAAQAAAAGLQLGPQAVFEHPTVAEMAQATGAQPEDSTEVSTETPAEASKDVGPPLVRVDRSGELPLSFAQQRLWFLDRYGSGAAYNLVSAYRFEGELVPDALEQAIQGLVHRHELLRTHFTEVSGEPVQHIVDRMTIDMPTIDLTARSAAERQSETQRIIDAEFSHIFDVCSGPLLRTTLARLSEREYVLIVNMHHLVSDGVSMEVFFDDVKALYAARLERRTPQLPKLPVQYVDFAAWQRSSLHSSAMGQQLEYWKEQLAGVETLNLPEDRPRPARLTYGGATHRVEISDSLSKALATFSRERAVTPFMTTLTACLTLLQRYSSQDDIVVGSPVANRQRPEFQKLMGFFINTLVLRADCSGDPSFDDLLARVRETAVAAFLHQDLPFERLVEELNPERDTSRNPLYQIAFVYNAPRTSLDLPGAEMTRYPTLAVTSRHDLEFHVWELQEKMHLSLIYNTDLFDPETIERIAEHYLGLLASAVEKPETAISRLPLLADVERRSSLEEWSGAATDYPHDASIHELFAEQVAATPDATALVFGDQQVTYAELDRRANQVAHHLRSLGVEHETLVGLCVERSVEMVVGILGILKAGGAYVPLDPSYPVSRLALMLEDTQASLLLTQQGLAGLLSDFDGTTVFLDTDWPTLASRPTTAPMSEATADSLAYIIYTSGSTGVPKGVCVEHRSVVRLVRNTNYVELGPDEVFLQFAPISFDASTFELWGSLLNGARLVIFPPQVPSLEELSRVIDENGITTLWLTAALFKQIVDSHPESLAGVRQLLAGGEELSAPHVRRFLATLGDRRLVNGYGPTENTTFTCCHVMTGESVIGRSVPIGRPISNTQVYVLDKNREPVPVGIPGRLYAGGDGLARCYLNDAELTAKKFVPHPFSDDPRAHLYDIGDQVRWLPDGTLEFLGRVDQQVKIRGFRIELGEIETALLQHPLVREAAVLCHGDATGEKRLVAYVVPGEKAKPGDADLTVSLRASLAATLPGYMVPAGFALLEALPLTANGKLDRTALKAVECVEEGSKEAFVAPGTPTEQRVAQIWADLFKTNEISIHDDFFRLGGHSLMAMRVISRLHTELDVELPVQSLFSAPTVAGMAKAVDVLRWAATNFADGDVDPDHEDFEL